MNYYGWSQVRGKVMGLRRRSIASCGLFPFCHFWPIPLYVELGDRDNPYASGNAPSCFVGVSHLNLGPCPLCVRNSRPFFQVVFHVHHIPRLRFWHHAFQSRSIFFRKCLFMGGIGLSPSWSTKRYAPPS